MLFSRISNDLITGSYPARLHSKVNSPLFLGILSIFISGYITAIFLNKNNKLPMCFIFEWNDDNKNKPLDFQI